MLGDRHRDAAYVGLLETVSSDEGGTDLTSDGHQWHRIQVGVVERGDEVGRAWPRGRHAHTHLSGGDCVPLCGMASSLFMAHQDVPHPRGIHQRIIGWHDRTTGKSEDNLGTELLEALDDDLCASHHLLMPGFLGHAILHPWLRNGALHWCCQDPGQEKTLAAEVAHEGASYPRMRTLTNNEKLAVHAFELRA